VPDEHHRLRAAMRQGGDAGHDIEYTFGQDVGVTVAQPQGGDPVLTQHVCEPGKGRPAQSRVCETGVRCVAACMPSPAPCRAITRCPQATIAVQISTKVPSGQRT